MPRGRRGAPLPQGRGVSFSAADIAAGGNHLNGYTRPGSFQRASLALAGFIGDADVPPHGVAAPGGRQQPARRARSNSPYGAQSMAAAMRTLERFDRNNANARAHCAVVLYESSEGELDNGMPAVEVEPYLGSREAVRDLTEAAQKALGNAQFNGANRAGVRVDFWYTTRQAEVPHIHFNIPQARLGNELENVPLVFKGARYNAGNPNQLTSALKKSIDAFKEHIDSMPVQNGSGRVLDSLICAQVWVTPRIAAAAVGGMREGYIPRADGLSIVDGEHVLPEALFKCHLGIIPSNPHLNDGRCIARAILMALDPVYSSRSDASLLVILQDAQRGAESKHRALLLKQQACNKTGGVVSLRYALLVAASQKKVASLTEEVAALKARYVREGVFMRKEGTVYRTDARYSSVEAALKDAFANRHPLIDFSKNALFFSRPQPVNEETVDVIRACIRPLKKIKIQFWGVGSYDKVGLNYPAEGATLQFLKEGGKVLNILVAHKHASFLVDVGAACNHAKKSSADAASKRTGLARGRNYCGLCGSHGSKGNAGDQLAVFDHQLKGCLAGTRTAFTVPLSPSNRRQLSKRDYVARNCTLVNGFFAISEKEEGASVASVDSACLKLCCTQSFVDETGRRGAQFKELLSLAFTSSVEAGPAAKQTLLQLVSRPVLELIWSKLHSEVPKNLDTLDILKSSTVCYGCHGPVHLPSRWKLQDLESVGLAKPSKCQHKADKEEGEEAAELFEEVPGDFSLSSTVEEEDDDEDEAETEEELLCEEGETSYHERICQAEEEAGPKDDVCAIVQHHCHATGATYWAHADCNSFMRQSSSTLWIELESQAAAAAVVDTVFKRSFIETVCNGLCPVLTSRDGQVRKITVKIQMAERHMSAWEQRLKRRTSSTQKQYLTLCFRARSALLPSSKPLLNPCAATKANVFASEVLEWAERSFQRTQLWPLWAETCIGFSRMVLYDAAASTLHPSITATSITSPASLESANRLTKGGLMVMGERVEVRVTEEETASRRRAILYLDQNSAYGAQLKRTLPLLEHEDRIAFNFSADLEKGLEFLRTVDTSDTASKIYRVELSGAFPAALHASLQALPPVYSKVDVPMFQYSRFQRLFMHLDMSAKAKERNVGHFFPLENHTVFACTAKLYLRLGFKFTQIQNVWETPASPWARKYACVTEMQRREAQVKKDKATVADIKAAMVSVIGSLNMDTSKFCNLRSVLPWKEEEREDLTKFTVAGKRKADEEGIPAASDDWSVLTPEEKIMDSPGYTFRNYSAGDVRLFEMAPSKITHRQQTLAALYIVERQRLELLELWYGNGDDFPGLKNMFTNIRVVYGNTDSLIVDVALSEGETRFTDVRHEFFDKLGLEHDMLDVSNVPDASTFWDATEFTRIEKNRNQGRWGRFKEETGFAGVEAVLINGPNRWGYDIVQHPLDTPEEFRGTKKGTVLKSIPAFWKELDLETPLTLADYAASWLNVPEEERRPAPPLEDLKTSSISKDFGVLETLKRSREHICQWGNMACIVSRTPPYAHLPLGLETPEAEELRLGTRW